MTKGNSEQLAIEELIELLKKIGKLRASLTVAKDCIDEKLWLTRATLTWADTLLLNAISVIGTLCTGLDASEKDECDVRPSAFFERAAKSIPIEAYVSLYDLQDILFEINSSFFATKISYAETSHPLYTLWETIEELFQKAKAEIQNAINTHK